VCKAPKIEALVPLHCGTWTTQLKFIKHDSLRAELKIKKT